MKAPDLLRNRKVRLALLAALCLVTLWQVKRQWEHVGPSEASVMNIEIPPPQWNSEGKVLGNPQNAIDDLGKLHKCFLIYREKFKRYPANPIELLGDMGSHYRDYGLAKAADAKSIFTNPDTANSTSPTLRAHPNQVLIYSFAPKRFDGQAIGSPKPRGKRDVLAFTDLYYFPNDTVNWNNIANSTMNPVGFYIVLWDDGRIEKIAFDKVLYVPQGKNNWGLGFPNQAGLPQNTKSYDEFNRNSPTYRIWKRSRSQ